MTPELRAHIEARDAWFYNNHNSREATDSAQMDRRELLEYIKELEAKFAKEISLSIDVGDVANLEEAKFPELFLSVEPMEIEKRTPGDNK